MYGIAEKRFSKNIMRDNCPMWHQMWGRSDPASKERARHTAFTNRLRGGKDPLQEFLQAIEAVELVVQAEAA